jgi:hypothetical protein
MSAANLFGFLNNVAGRADLLDSLKVQSKAEVIAAAAGLGYPFSEAEFDALIWDVELKMAERRQEPFDQHFPLWDTMWGQYYLEYLVLDMIPSLAEMGIDPLAAASGPKAS